MAKTAATDDTRTDEQKAQAAADEKATLEQAEAMTASLPQPGTINSGKMTGTMYAEAHDDKTVKMLFPQGMALTDQNFQAIHFEPGIQEVPASLADHAYLKAHGVTRV